MKIHSPVATGNGAFIVHQLLAEKIAGYRLHPYNPYWTLFPPALYAITGSKTCDLIHTTPDYAQFSARKNKPLVITFHNYVLDTYMQHYSSLPQRIHYATDLKWFTRRSVRLAQRITAVSRFTADLVRRETGTDREIRVIYNGIDEQAFRPEPVKNPSREITVLFSGNLSRRKGANLLPAIADRLNTGIRIVYTSGLRVRTRLPEHPAMQGIRSVPFQSMPGLYRDADILLFPTMREGFGLAAAEAMACSLPVVASDCSSIPELVTDGKGGFLCEPGNAAAFADRINQLADSPGLRHEMGQYNRNRVEELFTLTRMVSDYRELFLEVMDSSSQQPPSR